MNAALPTPGVSGNGRVKTACCHMTTTLTAITLTAVFVESTGDRAVGATAAVDPVDRARQLVASIRSLPPDLLQRRFAPDGVAVHGPTTAPLRELDDEAAITVVANAAVEETDPLLKAVLTWGAYGWLDSGRAKSRKGLDVALQLAQHYSHGSNDPFEVGDDLAFYLDHACVHQGLDYNALVLPILEHANNPALLRIGFLFVRPTADRDRAKIRTTITQHQSPVARIAAYECLRVNLTDDDGDRRWFAGILGELLHAEHNPRLVELALEGLAHIGSPEAIDHLEEYSARNAEFRSAVTKALLFSLPVEEARAFVANWILAGAGSDPVALEAACLFARTTSAATFAELVREDSLAIEMRATLLRALWNGTGADVGQCLSEELASDRTAPAELRVCALRQAFLGRLSTADDDFPLDAFLDAGEHPRVRALAHDLALYSHESIVEPLDSSRPAAAGAVGANAVRWQEPASVVGARQASRAWSRPELSAEIALWDDLAERAAGVAAVTASRRAARLRRFADAHTPVDFAIGASR